MCRPCHGAGKRSKLAEFDLGPDGPAQTHHTVGQWSDGDSEVNLRCPRCRHERPLLTESILEALGAITGKTTAYL
jgi:hypothetical protein